MKVTIANQSEKGWMLKMVGSSICSKTGLKLKGKYGTYIVKEKIGKGGNGIVYVAELYDGGEELPYKGNYAIKFLEVSSKYVREKEKRVQRLSLIHISEPTRPY